MKIGYKYYVSFQIFAMEEAVIIVAYLLTFVKMW
jgi:hypothetical protein